MPTATAAPHSLKAEFRSRLQTLRSGCDPAWGVRLAGQVLNRLPPRPGAVVAGFWPLAGEIDIRPLLLALAGRGHVVCLPHTPPRGQPLSFHRWRPGAKLLPGRFETVHPPPDPVQPDYVLAPLLAFDRQGGRLGYGGGYYDLTFAALPSARLIGCAFAIQEVERVPVEAHDLRLFAVATETGLHRTER